MQPGSQPQAAVTIHRAVHNADNPYVMTRRDSAQDTGLSYEAAGMLMFLLSKPDDWIIIPETLVRPGCTLRQVKTIFSELVKAGYMKRQAVHGERGRFVGWTYHVFEEAQKEDVDHVAKKPLHGATMHMVRPSHGKSTPIHNKDKELQNTETKQNAPAPVSESVKVNIAPTTFEDAAAESSPEAIALAAQAMARLQPERSSSKRVDITPDGIQAGAAFLSRFSLKTLDDDIQQWLQKLVNRFGLYPVKATILQIDPAKAQKPIGLLTWMLEDMERTGTLPKLMPYSPTTTVPNAPAQEVKRHWKYSQVYVPPVDDSAPGRLMQNLIERQQQREKEKWHGSSVQSGS